MQEDLVSRAQQGDTDAFRALIHGCVDRLYAIAFRIVRDHDRAEDALQQALIDLWDDLPGLRDPGRFDAWACRLVVHASYREARRERRWTAQVRQLVADPPGDDATVSVASRDEVERVLRRLTPEHRAVLVLRYYVGQSVAEIAETLGIPVGTAGSRLHYAVRCMRAAYAAEGREALAWRTTA